MSGWLAFAVSAVLSLSLMMHLSVVMLQATVLVIESLGDGWMTRRFFYPALVQNLAVLIALLGFALGDQELRIIGALVLALGFVTSSGRPHPTYATIEAPLLVSGLLSLVGIAVQSFSA